MVCNNCNNIDVNAVEDVIVCAEFYDDNNSPKCCCCYYYYCQVMSDLWWYFFMIIMVAIVVIVNFDMFVVVDDVFENVIFVFILHNDKILE